MVFAMLFVVAVGLGPFAGVLALWVHTTGVLAKLFAEAVEAIDTQPVPKAFARPAPAQSRTRSSTACCRRSCRLWISYALYRFESNVRSASVVGMVGAGGIGVVLYESDSLASSTPQTCRGDDHHRGEREPDRPGVGAHPQGADLGAAPWL
jgi:phosphonate transport system permease protein